MNRVHDLNILEGRLLNALQQSIPLVERPWARMGEELGIAEEEVMDRITKLREAGVIRQISPIFDTGKLGYESTLVAAQVEESRIDGIAQIINGHPGVTHNYKRNHPFNLWFTLAVPPGENLESAVDELIGKVEDPVREYMLLPALRVFKIGVKLDMEGTKTSQSFERRRSHHKRGPLTESDKLLIREIQEDLPLVKRPFAGMAERLGVSQADLFAKVKDMERAGLIRRFAAVLNHREAGFRGNGMVCWKVPQGRIEEAGKIAAAFPQVSHCYQRPTYPDWPYSLYTMIHARAEEECREIAAKVSLQSGMAQYEILFSTKEYKKTRMEYFV